MDLGLLKVYNEMYKFGLTDQDFLDIVTEQKSRNTGVFVLKHVKDGSYMCVSNDDTVRNVPQLSIKKLDYPTPIPPKSRILFKTLITFGDLPEEVYMLHSIAHFRSLDSSIKDTANSLEELKDIIIERFADKYPKDLGEAYDNFECSKEERKKNAEKREVLANKQLDALCWLFNEKPINISEIKSRENIAKIIKIWERKNKRICLIMERENWTRKFGGCMNHMQEQIIRTTLSVVTYRPSDIQYNYADLNREIFKSYECNQRYATIWVSDALYERVSNEELTAISEGGSGWILLTPERLNQEGEKIRSRVAREVLERTKDKFVNEISKQFQKGAVTRFGITFTKTWFGTDEIKIGGYNVERFLASYSILAQDTPNFQSIVENYLSYVAKDIQNHISSAPVEHRFGNEDYEFKPVTLNLNQVKLKIEPFDKSIKSVKINGKKIWLEDLLVALKVAMNLDKKGYEEFLDKTTKIPIKVQLLLEKGWIDIEMEDRIMDCDCVQTAYGTIHLSLPFCLKEKPCVLVGDKPIFVKNMRSLLLLAGSSYGGLGTKIKEMQRAFSKITEKDIGYLIKKGRAEYKKRVAAQKKLDAAKINKSLDFIKNAARLSKASRAEKGWLVTGLSGMVYYVGDDLKVYTIKDGKQDKYLCIVDPGTNVSTIWGRNDAIAKRLLTLCKDLQIVQEVYTVNNALRDSGLISSQVMAEGDDVDDEVEEDE